MSKEFKDKVHNDFKSIHYKLWALLGGRFNTDPDEVVTPEMTVRHLAKDNSKRFKDFKLYPDWAQGAVVGLDATLIGEDGRTFPLRFITQNPKKKDKKDARYLSEYAKLVQNGHTITWVLLRKSEKETEWKGRIQDGQYIPNGEQRVVEPETPQAQQSETPLQDYVRQISEELPHVPQEHIEELVQSAVKLGLLQ